MPAATSKPVADLTRNDKIIVGNAFSWKGKALRDCSKGELIECIIHMAAQVVWLKDKLDKTTIPFYRRPYWLNRFHWRGTTWLGLFNTVCAFVFNRVLVQVSDMATPPNVSWTWRRGTDFSKEVH